MQGASLCNVKSNLSANSLVHVGIVPATNIVPCSPTSLIKVRSQLRLLMHTHRRRLVHARLRMVTLCLGADGTII